MRVLTLNVNGLRAAVRKGFYDWLQGQDADFVCVQEIKARPEQLSERELAPDGYHAFYEPGERKGHSGVALFTRVEPDEVRHGFGSAEFDPEGRYIEARFGDVSIASVYVPSGTSGEVRLAAKYRFIDEFSAHLARLAASDRHCILCGDWNVAHKEIDLTNHKANQKNSGFLPEERAWLDRVFGPLGFVDAFRQLNAGPGEYSWWSQRHPTTRDRNVGWRLDYQVVTPGLGDCVVGASMLREPRFSDHGPVTIDYAGDPD
ncbi:MAG: exodeoxyribonuclease III [Polyangiales bacterium]